MIGSVRGSLIERSASGEVLVEVGGVGYRVNVPLRVIPTLDPGHQPAGLGLGRPTKGAANGSHPTLGQGEAGVGRTPSSDPGHS